MHFLRIGYQRLSHYATKAINKCLLVERNMKVVEKDGTLMIAHNGDERYLFVPEKQPNGSWKCHTLAGRPCYKNVLYGIPCVHCVTVWVHLINRKDDYNFDYDDVERSVHKIYRQNTYAGATFNHQYSFAMPLFAVTSQVKRMEV